MAEWESSYGGIYLQNAKLLTNEEIEKRYPPESSSRMALLTREFVDKGYDILYGENHRLTLHDNWSSDVIVTAAYLYHAFPNEIVLGGYTDMSESGAIYAAVKTKKILSKKISDIL